MNVKRQTGLPAIRRTRRRIFTVSGKNDMKLPGQLVVGLLGGIIAIMLYRAFENNRSTESAGDERGRQNTFFSADSINNVFNVGFGEAAEGKNGARKGGTVFIPE